MAQHRGMAPAGRDRRGVPAQGKPGLYRGEAENRELGGQRRDKAIHDKDRRSVNANAGWQERWRKTGAVKRRQRSADSRKH